MLNIQKRERVKGFHGRTMLLYSYYKDLGKTTQCNNFPKPLMVLFEDNARDITMEKALAINDDYNTFLELVDELENPEFAKENDIETIVIDGLEVLFRDCERWVCNRRGTQYINTDLSGKQGFGQYIYLYSDLVEVFDRLFNHCASQNLNLVIITKGIPETINQNGDKVETGRIVPIDFGKKYMDNIVDKVEFLGYIVPNKESSVVLFGNTEKSIGSVKIKNFPKKLEWNAETFLKAVDEATKNNKVTTSQTVLKQHMNLEECKEKLMQAVKDCEDKSKAKDIYSKYLDDTLPDNLVKSQIGNAERVIELLNKGV